VKKTIVTLLKQTWFYILCMELLFFLLFSLAYSPDTLYSVLPAWYDVWEKFAVMHLGWYLSISALFLFLFTFFLTFCEAFSRKFRGWRKAGVVVLYVFLTFFALSIFLPLLGRAREGSRRISCFSNLRSIRLALQQYALDYESHLPPDLKTLSNTHYLTDKGIFRCPSRVRENSNSGFSDYLYYGAGHKLGEKTPFPLVKDQEKNHPGKYWNLIMSDGHFEKGCFGGKPAF
jgi:Protein of unknown function (DUF1559)